MATKLEKNNPRTLFGWAMYDWANSVFSLTIATAVFPIFFQKTTSSTISFLGVDIPNSSLYSYTVSAAFLLIALLSPILSGIADFRGNKKKYMSFFATLGSFSCMMLFFFDGSNVGLGLLGLLLGTVGFAGSLVFYNSYLPDIATPDRFDKVSANGFALGYIGSVFLLILNLLMIEKPELFSIPSNSKLGPQISFLSVGIWWLVFSQYSLRRLPPVLAKKSLPIGEIVSKGYKELRTVFSQLKSQGSLKKYLSSFFILTMGVQTVMYLASIYGEKELQLETTALIITVLVIQLIAIPGAYFFSFLSRKAGNMKSLMLATSIWIVVCIWAYYLPAKDMIGFVSLGCLVGFVMGGIQSTARATYSKLLPETKDTASYFSFFEFTDKIGIVLGTFSYGLIEQITGSMRYSVVLLTILDRKSVV